MSELSLSNLGGKEFRDPKNARHKGISSYMNVFRFDSVIYECGDCTAFVKKGKTWNIRFWLLVVAYCLFYLSYSFQAEDVYN